MSGGVFSKPASSPVHLVGLAALPPSRTGSSRKDLQIDEKVK